ncbi:helix-turn-helix transcriptional regulator [Pseudomonas guariconensis]|uniref:helix-turn-helix domain-containing protein n=1 Tax=Pseudomonas TaxID=286 RepID=UPI001CE49E4C|nr:MULTISPECIES: helix-turn-helix transcriptional regulator [Pseudomonas]MCO7641426.1 helix-turn-helix transcriptional regulator [Pseudomonas sp. S 311-6]MCO7516335.1 helix-turn-helix transcriptional regulator [Pseudomonas putida]MCO7566640.1 helix-turn-helix transcriptional regulator [Pseudomonas mosselii]MCO7596637.1 helix-turn-helix transcriptional regulator [Pseudomonas guariconensis]MCO7606596.1 helix-turn-helix transcriptional regulator [Pseudomonas guariconensis]
MGIQVISRDGQPEYAVVPWEQYQALLKAAGQAPADAGESEAAAAVDGSSQGTSRPSLAELAHLRQAKGLAPEQLARNVGISPAYLAMIEAGERQPDAAILRSLAWHLGVAGWSEPS